jgi:hypothetical protein
VGLLNFPQQGRLQPSSAVFPIEVLCLISFGVYKSRKQAPGSLFKK